jgi:hypothetical protein
MSQYLILLYDDPAAVQQFRSLPPDQIQRAMQPYIDWGNKARQAGFLVGSNKLTDDPGASSVPNPASHASPTAPSAKPKNSSAATTSSKLPATTKP